jgi:hypothetical protein
LSHVTVCFWGDGAQVGTFPNVGNSR